jgi:hypothetical protein
MRFRIYIVSATVAVSLVLGGCGGHGVEVATTSGGIGSGGSGGTGSGTTSGGTTSGGTTSGGTTSGGTTSGGTGSGGTGGGSGGSGGSGGGSGGSGGLAPGPPGSGIPARTGALPSGEASLEAPVQGVVNGGEDRAIVGARVYVLEAAAAGFGRPAISLLTTATGHAADSVGHYVLTGEYGGFSIAGDYTCKAGHTVYLLVRGGNSGGEGANEGIGLMASLGTCPASGTFTQSQPFVFVNEVTTVAAAYGLAGSATDATHISGGSTDVIAAGMATAARLASVSTGFVNSRGTTEPSRRMLHTLANILAACINSGGSGSGACTTLFAKARSGGATGTIPADTATAALNIARNPDANVLDLYDLQPIAAPPFLPALGSPPPDFKLASASGAGGISVAALRR